MINILAFRTLARFWIWFGRLFTQKVRWWDNCPDCGWLGCSLQCVEQVLEESPAELPTAQTERDLEAKSRLRLNSPDLIYQAYLPGMLQSLAPGASVIYLDRAKDVYVTNTGQEITRETVRELAGR